jgi:mono/diheme cytochrome c family protein
MKPSFVTVTGVIAITLGAATIPTATSAAQENKKEHLIPSVKGVDLYQAHCAVCHGKDATGNGPAASALKTRVPDLTRIAQRNGNKFPAQRVREIISGTDTSNAAHGSREMPIWGPIFHQIEWDQDLGHVRIENLTKYLQSIQKK